MTEDRVCLVCGAKGKGVPTWACGACLTDALNELQELRTENKQLQAQLNDIHTNARPVITMLQGGDCTAPTVAAIDWLTEWLNSE
jgi:hypothetical protein